MMTNKEEMNLLLDKSDGQSCIFLEGQVLKSFNGDFEVKDQDHELIERLYNSFKNLKEYEVKDGSVVAEKYEENKIFELYKRITENQEDMIGEYFHHFIQWTPVFRSAPDPRIKMEQYEYYGPLLRWLEERNLEMEDLPLNYCQSGEEFEATVKEYEESGSRFKVSDPLVEALVGEAKALNHKQQAGLMYLYFSFDEPVSPLLLLAGYCTPEEMAKATLAAAVDIPGRGIKQEEFDRVFSVRMDLGNRVLNFVN